MNISIFDIIYEKYIIKKPIRLIELFGGYGSQHLALKYLGADVEHWKLVEWAVKSIQAYKDLHYTDINIDYSKGLTKEEMVDYLFNLGISSNYNEPMTYEQIKRINETQLRNIYNNIKITKNLVNIQNVKGKDLEIVNTDKYDYILTYSFPCQDLSLAGKRKGMSDTSTRSGMLWEVERILSECKEIGQLPQVLLMENVPQVIGKDNVEHFNKWQFKLESLGYKNYHQNLIATDYGIPQTRNRTFMVSILGNYSYTFPKPTPLKLKLKDMLEDNVSEKYYLSDKMLNYCTDMTDRNGFIRGKRFNPLNPEIDDTTFTITTSGGSRPTDNFIAIPEATKKGYAEATDGDGVYINRPHQKRGVVQKNKIQTLKTSPDTGVVVKNNLKSKLCNELIEKGLVKENDVIKHSYTSNKLNDDRLVPNHNISPTLDTRCDCLGVCVGTYQYAKSDNFMQGKDRLQLGKEVSDTLQTTQKEATKKGFAEATDGDSINLEQPNSKTRRGRVGKGVVQTLMTNPQQAVILGNYSPSNHNASRIVDSDYSAPTVMENHGTITATNTHDLRIRKLTPKECFRLMGVNDEDYERIAKNQSNSSLYHLAGDSIVVNVLMAIFKELLRGD